MDNFLAFLYFGYQSLAFDLLSMDNFLKAIFFGLFFNRLGTNGQSLGGNACGNWECLLSLQPACERRGSLRSPNVGG